MTDLEDKAAEIARGLTKPMRRAMRYYELEDVSPKDTAKIHHPENTGWGSRTIDNLLDRGLLCCGPHGWHIFTPLGRAVANHLKASSDDR